MNEFSFRSPYSELSNTSDASVRRKNPKTVLLWTQVRSGSSFTASILGLLPNSIRTSEPVRSALGDTFSTNKTDEVVLSLLRNVINCNLTTSKFIGDIPAEYCFPKMSRNLCMEPEYVFDLCRTSHHHIIKLVATRLDLGKELLTENVSRDMKIVHLVRDPRGILTSTKYIKLNHYLHEPDYFCSRMREDLVIGQQLSKLYPDR